MRKFEIENGKLKIEDWPRRNVNWRRTTLQTVFALNLLCFFAGCPEAQVVTVTMKTVEGAPGAAAGEGTAAVAEAEGYGSFSGTITVEGSVPTYPPLVALGGAGLKP